MFLLIGPLMAYFLLVLFLSLFTLFSLAVSESWNFRAGLNETRNETRECNNDDGFVAVGKHVPFIRTAAERFLSHIVVLKAGEGWG
jgi:hypothetical protein